MGIDEGLHRLAATKTKYSDASFQPGDASPGIDWFILKPGRSVQGRAGRVPVEVMEALLVRKTQIYAAEAYAILAAVYEHLTDLKNTDAVFFVDNEAACAALIRGSSTQSDVGAVVNAVHWMLFSINCRPWFEWIDSASNCSDGLSRDGLKDTWKGQQGWKLQGGRVPPWNAVTEFRGLALKTLGVEK